jgi:hypothetical protein
MLLDTITLEIEGALTAYFNPCHLSSQTSRVRGKVFFSCALSTTQFIREEGSQVRAVSTVNASRKRKYQHVESL